jgi:hypothetical protein
MIIWVFLKWVPLTLKPWFTPVPGLTVLALLLALVLLPAARTSEDVSEAATINTVTTASISLSLGFLLCRK